MLKISNKNALEALQNQLQKEQQARKAAELKLKEKADELHRANEVLLQLNQNLEVEIADRTNALEASERRYRQIIDTAADLISRMDANGYFTYINPFACNMYGYKPEDIIGKHFLEFVHPEHKEHVAKFYYEIRRKMRLRSYYEFQAVSKSGESYWLGQNIQLIIEGGRVKEITAVARDITAQVEAEKALRTARTRLSTLITDLQSGVLVEDENGRTLLVNQHFIDLFNLNSTPELMSGMYCSEITKMISDKTYKPASFLARTQGITAQREPVTGEELRLNDGTLLAWDYIPIYVDQTYLGHLNKYRDVTEERMREDALRRSEEKYRGIIENMELGLIELDLNHTIVRAYDLFCDMTGFTQEELVGRSATDTFLPQEYSGIFRYSENKSASSSMLDEVQIKRKDGTLIWALLSGAPIYDRKGNISGSICIYYDITNRKKLEQDLAEAKRVAEAAQEVEQQFLARMSHEIRTPLNAIIGLANVLYDTEPTQAQRESLSIIKSSADLLLDIISNILDFSKIRAGEYELKDRPFHLKGLITSLQKTFQVRQAEKNKDVRVEASVDPHIPEMLVGDDVVLNQILVNLLDNAHKFTTTGVIGMKVKQVNRKIDQCELEFTVFDTGIGIPEDQLKCIFEDFKQLPNDVARFAGGTGLGLAITNKFIELQNGKIWVESQEGKGTTFSFTLTYRESAISVSEHQIEAPLIDRAVSDQGQKFLVAEDNLMNRKYISSLLNKWNIEFIFAHNGKEAVELCKEQKFSVILMDISMPEMDGFEATINIRNTPNPNQQTPILALTASALVSTRERAFSIGMSDFLAKPFKPFQLQELIKKYAGNRFEEDASSKTFCFNAALDTTYLEEVYDGDIEYASEIFEIFLTHTILELHELDNHIERKDWDQTSKLAHKLKPTFSMVGLTNLESKMLMIEKQAGSQEMTEEIPEIFKDIQTSLEENLPKLEKDLEKMRDILKLV